MSIGCRRGTNVTIFDIAREVGVHASTVSRALDPKQCNRVKDSTRREIERVAQRLNYRRDLLAGGLRTGKTNTIGVVAEDLTRTAVTPIIRGLSLKTGAMTMPLIAETQGNHDRLELILSHMLSRRVDGLVVAAGRRGDGRLLARMAGYVPIVLAARSLPSVMVPQAIHDDVAGARMIAQHFHHFGHRRVVQLRGSDVVSSFARRAEGFSAACRELGLIEVQFAEVSSSVGIEEGERLVEALLREIDPLPTAIFAQNDLMAIGALVALRRAGISVPNDVSVAGYNNIPMSEHVSPPLTTVNSRSFEVGEAAGEMIVEYIAGHRPSDRRFEPILVPRASTAAAPDS